MLRLNKISKKFGDKTVIDSLDLCIPDGRTVAICGVSGSGKSTLLSIIAGLVKADEGTVEPSPASMSVSMSFQEPRLLSGRTAAENVNLVMGDRASTLPLAREILTELGITDTEKYPSELSGGMAARVGIARSLAVKRDVYLFDEPFASLDEESRIRAAEVISRRTSGATVVMIIHDKEFARRIADTLIVFGDDVLNDNFTIVGASVERLN